MEIGTSSPVLEAGRPFSVLITIQNPFDVPVEVTAVTTVAPVEFIDLERRNYERQRKREIRTRINAIRREVSGTFGDRLKSGLVEALSFIFEVLGAAVGLSGLADTASHVLIATSAAISGDSKTTSEVQVKRPKSEVKQATFSTEDDQVAASRRIEDIINEKAKRIEARNYPSYLLKPRANAPGR